MMLFSLFWTFFKIGLFTFGGGYAMIANVRETVVEKKQWLSDDELLRIIAIAESTPGPIAINMATYVGYRKKGFLGSLLATLGVVLPSFVILFVISLVLDLFLANKYVAYAFVGIKCAVAFLIVKAGLSMLVKLDRKPLAVVLFFAVFVTLLVLDILSLSFGSIWFILAGGVLGILVYALFGRKRERNTSKEDKP